jgi:hypothetical protein
MLNRRKLLLTSALVSTALLIVGVLWLRTRPGCSLRARLNPDVICRTLDVREDGTYLIQYFDTDTNALTLYLQQNGRDIEIDHPQGKVKNFSARLDQNQIKFSRSDYKTLIVNGEDFQIAEKRP